MILASLPENIMKNVQSIQIMAAKLVLDNKKSNSKFENLRTLHWLPVRLQINFKILCIVYKCLKGQTLEYLKNLLCHADPKQYDLRANNNDK